MIPTAKLCGIPHICYVHRIKILFAEDTVFARFDFNYKYQSSATQTPRVLYKKAKN